MKKNFQESTQKAAARAAYAYSLELEILKLRKQTSEWDARHPHLVPS